ncbi:MAG TPA: hypothetical protein PK867_05850, partial [Pirellulales bacterium]|nr:hypothetical protein [Pirellulales bacterium]
MEEWLKGRTILTVAQDGSGQFKTIQAALDAMKTGQVVEVLDGGPYRESLRMHRPPENTGLVSRHGAIVEVDTWDRPEIDSNPYLYGHHLYRAREFRVSGFRFLSGYQKEGAQWYWQNPADLVVEDCLFDFLPNSEPQGPTWGMKTASWLDDVLEPIVVRDCFFSTGGINAAAGDRCVAPFLITRNYFHGHNAMLIFKTFRRLVVRQNVFDGPDVGLSVWWMQEAPEAFEIASNTFFGTAQNDFKVNVPQTGLVIRNNIFTEGLQLTDGAIRELANTNHWQLDHNCYQRRGSIPSTQTDLIVEPGFLSINPGDKDYLRVGGDGAVAKGGAGGAWPTYVGALRPGPAPKDGDWFTRLRDRWGVAAPQPAAAKAVDMPPPTEVPEPPPLEEWIKDREALTVAQDGSGQFRTIQAALDALQAGQVVKVLDRGPYREQLNVNVLPADTGLVSEVDTSIELPGYRFLNKGSQWEVEVGHH